MNKTRPICGRAHFYTPLGVVRYMRFCTAPKPPSDEGGVKNL